MYLKIDNVTQVKKKFPHAIPMKSIASQNRLYRGHRKTLITFKVLVSVLPLDDKAIELALGSDFKDFEDAIQYYTAIEQGIDIIITRNKKDFKNAKLPIMTAKEYLKK